MIKIIGCALFLTASLIGCGPTQQPSSPHQFEIGIGTVSTSLQIQSTKLAPIEPDENGEVSIYPESDFYTSLVQILADRNRYHGKKVQIEGYLHMRFEDAAIYVSKEFAEYGMTRNAFWVEVDKKAIPFEGVVGPKQFDKKYVLIEGVFDKSSHGHLVAFQGCIDKVDRILELRKHPE